MRICLIIRPDARQYDLSDMLFEFKYVSLKTLKLSGEKLREMPEDELLQKSPIKEAFRNAEFQIRRYAGVLRERFGQMLRLKAYIVVSAAFDRLLGKEIMA